MFRIQIVILLAIIFTSCSKQRKYPIESIKLDHTHYLGALSEIDREITQKPGDPVLRRRRLLINRELRWPDDVSEDIELVKKQEGLDYELLQYAIDFYNSHHYYELLLSIIEEWESLNGDFPKSDRWKAIALLGLNREEEARYMLWKLVQTHKSDQSILTFAADNYLKLNDSTRAIYALNRIAEINPSNPVLMESYVPLLLENGYVERAVGVLERQKIDTADVSGNLLLAQTFYQLGDANKAHTILSKYETPKVLYHRAKWYEEQFLWDSAVMCLNKVIDRDSSTTALLKKAELLDNRGWLSSSFAIYQGVLENDSTNSIAQEGARIVAQKIAYLRNLREAENTIPILEITSKKETENE
ncbi:MAG: hypothetical protein RIC35_05045 [Marinoscillum sp.]